jgi:cell division protein FtsL
MPVLLILLTAAILVGIKATDESNKLASLENKKSQLEQTNRDLKDKIIQSASLTQIGNSAKMIGLDRPEKFVYLTNDGIALR